MDIAKAENEIDWARASKLLIRVVERLNNLGRALWSKDQVSVVGLQRSYQLNELHFLLRKSCVGVVFLQEADPYFWPEVTERDSLYVHKLAIDPPLVTVHSTTYYRAPVLSSKVSPLTQLEVTYAHSNNPRQT